MKTDRMNILNQNMLIIGGTVISFLMMAPSTLQQMMIWGVIGALSSVCILRMDKGVLSIERNKLQLVVSILLSISLCVVILSAFIHNWKVSSIIQRISEKTHLSPELFLFIIGGIILTVLFPLIRRKYEIMIRNLFNSKEDFFCLIEIGIIALLQMIQIQLSCVTTAFSDAFPFKPSMMLLSYTLIILVGMFFSAFLNNIQFSIAILSCATTLWSLVNYYTIQYHGSPLFFSELSNLKTALTVVSNYSFSITGIVLAIIAMLLIEIIVIVIFQFMNMKRKTISFFSFPGIILIICYLIITFMILRNPDIKPTNTMTGSWKYGVYDYGYIPCFYEDIDKTRNYFIKPSGYNNEIKLIKGDDSTETCNIYPDFILILNESLFDLRIYMDLDLDSDYLKSLQCIDNSIYGYAVSASVAGGTNNSEYELLTSNSTALLTNSAPFNYIKLDQTGSNIVSYMNGLDYLTVGMHCGDKSNYSRNKAFPMLGFNYIMLGRDSFQRFNMYGNRKWLDIDNYYDLIDFYEKTGGNIPSFYYLLTLQNHGGYEQNEASFDLVHTKKDYGEITDDLNEYLTSVSLSVDAFVKLTDYFNKVDRPVIICMVGDHAPSIINELPARSEYSSDETEIIKRLVPYIIWANYKVEFPVYTEKASMVDLIPMMLKIAKMPLTTYYQYILKLHDSFPIRTSNGLIMDEKGVIMHYDENAEVFQDIKQYYCMEYNNLLGGTDYRTELFELK